MVVGLSVFMQPHKWVVPLCNSRGFDLSWDRAVWTRLNVFHLMIGFLILHRCVVIKEAPRPRVMRTTRLNSLTINSELTRGMNYVSIIWPAFLKWGAIPNLLTTGTSSSYFSRGFSPLWWLEPLRRMNIVCELLCPLDFIFIGSGILVLVLPLGMVAVVSPLRCTPVHPATQRILLETHPSNITTPHMLSKVNMLFKTGCFVVHSSL